MRRGLLLVLPAVVALAGCGSGDPEPAPVASSASTSASTSAPATPPAQGEAVAVPFSAGFSWRLSVAPDGETALMAHSDGFFPQTRESTIYALARQGDGGWADPVEVPFVDETTSDIDPVFSADGSRVWFSSIRPVDGAPREDVDVWYVDRAPDGSWGDPVHAPGINSPDDDLYPSLGPDGALYVGSDRGGQGFDLWASPPTADGGFGPAATLPPPVTTTSWEFNPAWSPDGSVLVFTGRNRDAGAGEGDLFATRLVDGAWTEPEPTLFFVRRGDLLSVPWPG